MTAVVGRFSGKHIVITGAGGGLGFAYAERLGAEGASITVAELDEARGTQAVAALSEQGVRVTFVRTDVTDEASVMELAAKVTASAPDPLHGIVTNAGWANGVGGRHYDELDSTGQPDNCSRLPRERWRGIQNTDRERHAGGA